MPDMSQFLYTIVNLSKYHREHEKFYAMSPLECAIQLQKASGILKTLADRWKQVQADTPKDANPFMGGEDLNETASIQETGVLFMEGEAQPFEITRLKRDLGSLADDFCETGEWLTKAMQSSWEIAQFLIPNPALASVLGERHRIIATDLFSTGILNKASTKTS